jgi:superfamily II DNA or RNA helicase
MPWFKIESMLEFTDDNAFGRGLDLFRMQRVMSIEMEPSGDSYIITGMVQGSKRMPYNLNIFLTVDNQGIIDQCGGLCSCPVGVNCKHCVALLMKASFLDPNKPKHVEVVSSSPAVAAVKPVPSTSSVSDYEKQMLLSQGDYEAKIWLESLEKIHKNKFKAGAPQPARKEQWIYMVYRISNHRGKPSLAMEAATAHQKVKGGWSKPKTYSSLPGPDSLSYEYADAQDLDILHLLDSMPNSLRIMHNHSPRLASVLQGQTGMITLQLAAQSGKLFFRNSEGYPEQKAAWGAPRSFDWKWESLPASNPKIPFTYFQLLPQMSDPSVLFFFNSPPLYCDPTTSEIGLMQHYGMEAAELQSYLNAPPLPEPSLTKIHHQFAQRRGSSVPLPPTMRDVRTISGVQPLSHLHLDANPSSAAPLKGLLRAQLTFDYQGHRGFWPDTHAHIDLSTAKETIVLERDIAHELLMQRRLLELGLEREDKHFFLFPERQSQQRWLHWAGNHYDALRQAGFTVSVDPILENWVEHAEQLHVDLQPDQPESNNPQWFDLSLGIEIQGQRHNILPWLPDLLHLFTNSPLDAETGQPVLPEFYYIPAPNRKGYTQIPLAPLQPWMTALLELSANDVSGESLRLSRFDALRTGAALGEGVAWQGAKSLTDMVQALRGQSALPVVTIPQEVHATLRPYQQHGVNWLQFLREHGLAGILADDMGLGKTLQVLVHIQCEKNAGRLDLPVLIIAPVSLMGNWLRETQRFCPTLRALVLHGKDRHEAAESIANYDVVIAPYSLLQRDRERWLNLKWHLVVLDEAQNIKNATTHAAQVVTQIDTRHRLCLSGTPMENHLGEIWSLFHFLMPGFLGSQNQFRTLFRNPIEKQGIGQRMQQLRARITPFMLRRTKEVVAHELPPRIDTIMRVELTGEQANLYETIRLGMEQTVREMLNQKGLAKSHITILDALLKLRQVCCDPQLVPLSAAKKIKASAKLEQLMEILPEMLAEGRRVLLFSQFTSMLTLIEKELQKRKLSWVKLTGQSQNRDALIERFTSGAVPLFLISLKAGGVGLNLPQADTVIHYDPWWNPAVENQATDRAHRIGQTQSVWVIKMVAQGTIEDRILALQERKAELAKSMYQGSADRKQPLFTESDLEELLKPLSASAMQN